MQPPSDAPPPTDDLQFDRAEYSAGPPAVAMCGVCHNTLRDRYFDINGKPACVACHAQIVGALNRGSRAGRAIKAFILGLLAALIGAAIYFGIAAVSGYELGIVAIVLGLLVGAAIRQGSNGRGGWFYQTMAILLTYFAICAAYASMAVREFVKNPQLLERMLDRTASQPASAPSSGPSLNSATRPADSESRDSNDPPPASNASMTDKEWEQLSGGEKAIGILFAILIVAFFVLTLPIFSATQNPIGFLIIGIALWQAWATNRGARVRIAGPFAVAGTAPPTAPPAPPPLPPGTPHA